MQIVARTNVALVAIINSEDKATSAIVIVIKLPNQTNPVKRIIFLDGLNFFRKLNSKTHGITYTRAISELATKPVITTPTSGLKLKREKIAELR